VDAERELVDGVVDEFDGVVLIVTIVDLEGSHACGIIDGRVLKAPDSMPLGALEAHNLHVCLNMMARDRLGVTVRVNGSPAHVSRQSTESVANQRPIHACIGDVDTVIADQVPRNSLRAKAVGIPEFQNPLYGLVG
jgi:hypothetical protein